jgi:hypothetical protein
MGKDVALVGYDMPAVNVSMPYSQFFLLIGPLGITLVGSVNLDLDLAFGFDSLARGDSPTPVSIPPRRRSFWMGCTSATRVSPTAAERTSMR